MSVRLHRDSWWVDFTFRGVRYRLRSPENTKTGAVYYEAHLRRELALGKDVTARPTRATNYDEFVGRWLRESVATSNKPSERESKRLILKNHLVPAFGRLKIIEITPARIERFKTQKLASGLARKTVNNILLVLSRSLTIAEEWGELSRRPKIRLLRLPPPEFDYLSPEESERLLLAIGDPFWRGAVLLALRTGLRRGELRGLDWSDFDLERGVLVVRQSLVRGQLGSPKSNKLRQVPLSGDVRAAFAEWPHRSGFVLGSAQGRTPLGEFTMRRRLKQFCGNARLRAITWHDLRHTFATQLVSSGVGLRVVQELLGHAHVHTTMRYAHVEPAQQQFAVERLDGLARREVGSGSQGRAARVNVGHVADRPDLAVH